MLKVSDDAWRGSNMFVIFLALQVLIVTITLLIATRWFDVSIGKPRYIVGKILFLVAFSTTLLYFSIISEPAGETFVPNPIFLIYGLILYCLIWCIGLKYLFEMDNTDLAVVFFLIVGVTFASLWVHQQITNLL